MGVSKFINKILFGVLVTICLVSCYSQLKITKDYVKDEFPIKDGFELFVGDIELLLNDSISIIECERILCVPKIYVSRFKNNVYRNEDDYWKTIFRKKVDDLASDKVVYFNQVNKNYLWVTKKDKSDSWEIYNIFPIALSNEFFYCFRLIDENLNLEPFTIFTYSDEKESFVRDCAIAKKIVFY